jgi:hypothetical protein
MQMARKTSSYSGTQQLLEKLGAAYPSIASRMPKALDQKSFEALLQAYASAMGAVHAAEVALKEARTVRRDHDKATARFVKHVHRAVVYHFGDDSKEYALVGGVRSSERKRPVRKPKAVAQP